jgi:hypothetical protein
MRIIGEIPHPQLKISIFKMGDRLSVKFENTLFEQTYKFGTDDRLNSVETIQKFIDPAFIDRVLLNFQDMNKTRLDAFTRQFPAAEVEEFETII